MTTRSRHRGRHPLRAMTAFAIMTAALGAVASCGSEEQPVTRQSTPSASPTATASPTTGPEDTGRVGDDVTEADLRKVAATRVFFGHQSVGQNVLDGIPEVFTAKGVPVPPVEQDADAPGPDGGFVSHSFIGQNEDPVSKIQAFDAAVRAGLGKKIDVAMMKFCYVDVVGGTDVDALFTAYNDTMDALSRDFPGVTFVAVTVPLTTQPGLLKKIRTGGSGGRDENVARQRLNELIRQRYTGRQLFDLAAVESTTAEGVRVAGAYKGQEYYALHEGFASDNGHLNADGSRRAATEWLRVVALASPK